MPVLNKHLIGQIILTGNEFERYQAKAGEKKLTPKRLENLEKINIFVGSNNSGKSRLIRSIAKNLNVYEPIKDLRPGGFLVRDLPGLSDYFRNRLMEIDDPYNSIRASSRLQSLFQQIAEGQIEGLYQGKSSGISFFEHAINLISQIKGDRISNIRDVQEMINLWAADCVASLRDIQKIEEEGRNMLSIYIPTLRTLRDLGNHHPLKKRTESDYGMEKTMIFTGESMYAEIERLLRGNLQERDKLRDFENWLSQTFFENRPIALIPRLGETTLTIKIGDEQEKPIHELGDGIQSILILTFELFRHQDDHVLAFIEEPEMFLHPWLQRVFLEMLSSKGRFPKHQFFLTTHSNHFLDLTLDVPDVSVYTIVKNLDHSNEAKEKPATFTIRQITRENREPLELLGVRNSSVLLSNCTIWVEGITDRRYLAHWLYLYDKFKGENMQSDGNHRVFKEDLHYSFVEYAGSNITHYSFLDVEKDSTSESDTRKIDVEWLCGRLFLVTDQDGADPTTAKGLRHALLKEKLGNRYYCLDGREIENLISPDSLNKVLVSYGEREYPELPHAKYLNRPLGTFLDDFLLTDKDRLGKRRYADSPNIKLVSDDPEQAPPKRKKKSEGSTISDKPGFCQRAIEATPTWSDLSPQAQRLTEEIYTFIRDINM